MIKCEKHSPLLNVNYVHKLEQPSHGKGLFHFVLHVQPSAHRNRVVLRSTLLTVSTAVFSEALTFNDKAHL